ncbi:MAG: ATP-binding cassette domain-containing protein [Quisquiliibacterium sp.]
MADGTQAMPPDLPAAPRLELSGIGVQQGELPILQDVSLSIDTAARTIVLGPNGAGKTTLLQAIHGLVPLSRGRIQGLAADGAVTGLRFGFVFQRPVMLRRSALNNVVHALAVAGVPASLRLERAAGAIKEVGLAYALHRSARRLSGGEQQRLAVARANALQPDCLLLDEPTANVDPAAGAALERYLITLQVAGRGFVMSTHDLAQARRLAQQVIFMHRGKVLEVAAAGQFFNAPRSPLAARFLEGQWLD